MNKNVKLAGIYLRVSTQEQSCDLQERELMQFIEARGWTAFETYEDKATGTNGNRPELKRLLRDARARKFDVLICWKLDRLFRSLKDLVSTLQELSDLGIEFVSLKDQIDLTTASGRLLTHLLAAFAEFEADLIKSRVKAGLANAKARGRKLGRPTFIDAQEVARLRAEGLSLNQIAKEIGASKAGVHKTLSKLASTK